MDEVAPDQQVMLLWNKFTWQYVIKYDQQKQVLRVSECYS